MIIKLTMKFDRCSKGEEVEIEVSDNIIDRYVERNDNYEELIYWESCPAIFFMIMNQMRKLGHKDNLQYKDSNNE